MSHPQMKKWWAEHSNRVTRPCEECKNDFTTPFCNRSNRFCSKSCYLEARKSSHYVQPNGSDHAIHPKPYWIPSRLGHRRENCWCGNPHSFGGLEKGVVPKNILEFQRRGRESRLQSPSGRYISQYQQWLYHIICQAYGTENVVMEYPIKTERTVRFADVAVPYLHLDFEYDGKQHNPYEDSLRDEELKRIGWKTTRYSYEDYRRWLERQ